MKIKFNNWGYDGKELIWPISKYVKHRINTEEDGIIETLMAQIDHIQTSLGNIIEVLTDKNIFSKEDIEKIIHWNDIIELIND